MKKNDIEKTLLMQCLPILDRSVQDEREKMVSFFKDIIVSKKENKEFFKSPVKYMKKIGIITIDSLEVSPTKKIKLYSNKAIVKSLRQSRELYKKDPRSILIPGGPDMLVVKEDVFVYADWSAVLCCTFSQSPEIIEKIDFGPLMAPSAVKKVKKLLMKKIK